MISQETFELQEELETLYNKINKVFIKELTILCKKHNVTFEQYTFSNIYDEHGDFVESGVAYDEIWELLNWLEHDMRYGYQSIVCNNEIQLAH